MAKKNFSAGIDGLLTPSVKVTDSSPEKTLNQNQTTNIDVRNEKLTSVHFRIPESLKIEIEIYCARNRMKQQELIMSAIQNYIKTG
jgi:tRNA uridine 5-carbamoylmethylation protein Kti12